MLIERAFVADIELFLKIHFFFYQQLAVKYFQDKIREESKNLILSPY